jgi:hypothetical protein
MVIESTSYISIDTPVQLYDKDTGGCLGTFTYTTLHRPSESDYREVCDSIVQTFLVTPHWFVVHPYLPLIGDHGFTKGGAPNGHFRYRSGLCYYDIQIDGLRVPELKLLTHFDFDVGATKVLSPLSY